MNTVYKCERCGAEFMDNEICRLHEQSCEDKLVWVVLTANLSTGKLTKSWRPVSRCLVDPNAELAPVVVSSGPLIAHVECADKDQLDQALLMLRNEIDRLRTDLLRYAFNANKLISDVDMRRKREDQEGGTTE